MNRMGHAANRRSIKSNNRKYDDVIPEIEKRLREGEKPASLAVEFNIPRGTLYKKVGEYRADEWIREVKR